MGAETPQKSTFALSLTARVYAYKHTVDDDWVVSACPGDRLGTTIGEHCISRRHGAYDGPQVARL